MGFRILKPLLVLIKMTAEVEILKESAKDTTTITMKALQFDDENLPFVYYKDVNGQVLTKPVTVGINDGLIVEIIDGVESGETILVPDSIINPMMMGPGGRVH